ncbi:hypothetical protein FHT39_000349 [Mitsuaria sp. BK045]|uniref:DUF6988 family protein n=1 Tax=unclassified Roseateles TaxID=2626991 RepID=UPI001622B4C0|nr:MULTISPECIES: hypothetical protein [unclassified Roseateles]MBB3291710.1 hypothetical protein [Mitsuaria sp. BK041]MBB3360927.1 hypothetical protein [Mitsuaria sp. BK045]
MDTIAAAESFGGANDREEASIAAAELALEHGTALNALFDMGLANSGVALLRLQYEALLRAAWLLYAATDAQVEKASAPLTRESADAAKGLPNAEQMLLDLERKLKDQPGLAGLVAPLRELRNAAWRQMNAFVHAGLHPLARTRDGFPEQLAVSVVKLSNGLVHLSARLLSRYTGDREVMRRIEVAYEQFKDVMPMATGSDAET